MGQGVSANGQPMVAALDCSTGELVVRPMTPAEIAAATPDPGAASPGGNLSNPPPPDPLVQALAAGTATNEQVQQALASLLGATVTGDPTPVPAPPQEVDSPA